MINKTTIFYLKHRRQEESMSTLTFNQPQMPWLFPYSNLSIGRMGYIMNNTRERILKVAENLLQNNGYNGFSYKDIANHLGIKTSSIHYYFPTKETLGIELIQEYQKILSKI